MPAAPTLHLLDIIPSASPSKWAPPPPVACISMSLPSLIEEVPPTDPSAWCELE